MKVPDIIIAVDGCSSTGKSTYAKLVAKTLGFTYLDSGAMYRGVTLAAMEGGLVNEASEIDLDGLRALLDTLDLHFRRDDGKTSLWMGERCIENEIRTMAVSSLVSPVSAIAWVRHWVDDKLHAFSACGRVIMDGRDIGTTVFPDAQLKIFMTASSEIRARRRYEELLAKGQNPSFEEVLENLRSRDYIDSHREASPLTQPADAFVLDNSDMTLEQELSWTLGLIQGRFGILC